jgi:hypothetical protein
VKQIEADEDRYEFGTSTGIDEQASNRPALSLSHSLLSLSHISIEMLQTNESVTQKSDLESVWQRGKATEGRE